MVASASLSSCPKILAIANGTPVLTPFIFEKKNITAICGKSKFSSLLDYNYPYIS